MTLLEQLESYRPLLERHNTLKQMKEEKGDTMVAILEAEYNNSLDNLVAKRTALFLLLMDKIKDHKLRDILIFYYLNCSTMEEIGEAVGLAPITIEKRLQRYKKQLKNL